MLFIKFFSLFKYKLMTNLHYLNNSQTQYIISWPDIHIDPLKTKTYGIIDNKNH